MKIKGLALLNFEIWAFQNKHLEPKGPVPISMVEVTKSAHFGPSCFEKKKWLDNFFQFYIYLNIVRYLYFNVKKMWGVTDLKFPEKHKLYPKIVICILLCAIISQKRNNAIVSAWSPLAIDVHLNKKCSPHFSVCSV